MKVLLPTPHDYDVQVNIELPANDSKRLIEFKPPDSIGARTHCLVAFEPHAGALWAGRFVGDYDEPPAVSLVCSAADVKRAFVVCAGRGYYVVVDRPAEFDIVNCYPICSVEVVSETPTVIFGSFTDVTAYGSQGLAWKSAGLVSDDLRIVEANKRVVAIEGSDAASGRTVRFALDATTGRPLADRTATKG